MRVRKPPGAVYLLIVSAAAAVCIEACYPRPAKGPAGAPVPTVDSALSPAVAQHDATGFPLRGRHASLPCDSCHGAELPKPACESCHASPHDEKLERACESCHAPGMPFSRVSFKHRDGGLVEIHPGLPCLSCHADRKFLTKNRRCTSCHSDYHQGSLGRSCEECHRGREWSNVRFNHAMTGFPLVGAHRAIDCGDCHRDLQSFAIAPRPTGCASCHEKDYRSSTFPHAAYAAGLNCQECHQQDAWTYAHSPAWFNIQNGPHAGVSCGTCHPSSQDYRAYTCHSCHAGHTGDNGGRCLDCHPGGFPGGGRD